MIALHGAQSGFTWFLRFSTTAGLSSSSTSKQWTSFFVYLISFFFFFSLLCYPHGVPFLCSIPVSQPCTYYFTRKQYDTPVFSTLLFILCRCISSSIYIQQPIVKTMAACPVAHTVLNIRQNKSRRFFRYDMVKDGSK